ncbi:MAG: hypothetical protein KME32_04395 [Mojavia pulchra JT2-VF2]|uniref:Uncharacterized protein n=1 Tax=Mojavia pulchra JT2-VF2 TaxID=287848 RepID=A0A951PVZ0_9NOST|nr:hypothetical protein [Mojavia pulchra JT2-VF2]
MYNLVNLLFPKYINNDRTLAENSVIRDEQMRSQPQQTQDFFYTPIKY